ncbi:MAG: hypothetical protein ISS19_09570 [Bacteroidales bacterium]|nr:hypothetical protein [Bacteroidales bacterium]
MDHPELVCLPVRHFRNVHQAIPDLVRDLVHKMLKPRYASGQASPA